MCLLCCVSILYFFAYHLMADFYKKESEQNRIYMQSENGIIIHRHTIDDDSSFDSSEGSPVDQNYQQSLITYARSLAQTYHR